jgi:Trypsin-like peptidase domain
MFKRLPVLLALIIPIVVQAQATQIQQKTAGNIYKMAGPSVVLVETYGEDGEVSGSGSGFLVSADGRILTNFHVIAHTKRATVKLANEDAYDAVHVLAVDKRKDIALLMIDAVNLPYLRLGRSETAQVGDRLYTLGTPLGFLQNTLSEGLLSGVRQMDGYKLFQLSAPISPGSSGSPVFDAQGEVVGIVKATIEEGQNLNFAIPIDYAAGMMNARELQSLSSFYEPDEQKMKKATITPTRASDESFPTHWRSLESGTSKIIRRDGDRIYVETVLPDAKKNAGCFTLADLKGKGDFFSGTVRTGCVCQYTRGLGEYARTFTNRFALETTIEITKLSPTRIEGRTMVPPKDSKLDCHKGTYTKPPNEWEEFVWIPE